MENHNKLAEMVLSHQQVLLKEWVDLQMTATTLRLDLMKESELRDQSRELLSHFTRALESGTDITHPSWKDTKDFLAQVAKSRAMQGFSQTETATFVFSLKQPLFGKVRATHKDGKDVFADIWILTQLLDGLGLYTTELYQKQREEVIQRQQQELLELSTPVVQLYDNILALPLIGTLDSARTQIVMESLLERIVETGAMIAIIDITGVPTVDTLVAQHLLKTVAAARLMGADCIISGIRPQIAQTIVHLGVNLSDVITKATLADAFMVALRRIGGSIETPRVLKKD
jgi:rsbT co-antagonist protein RsbR